MNFAMNNMMGIFAGGILVIVSLALFIPNLRAMDGVARLFEDHCVSGSKTTINVQLTSKNNVLVEDGDVVTVVPSGAAGTACAIPTSIQTASQPFEVELDNGDDFSATSESALAAVELGSYKKDTVNGTIDQFGTLNQLITGIWPMFLILASMAYAAGMVLNPPQGSISNIIMGEVVALLLVLAATTISPTVMSFLLDAAAGLSGLYGVTGQFGTLMALFLGLVPTMLVLGLMGMVAHRSYKSFKGRGDSGMM